MKGRYVRKEEEEGTLQFKSAPLNVVTSLPLSTLLTIVHTSSFIFFLQVNIRRQQFPQTRVCK